MDRLTTLLSSNTITRVFLLFTILLIAIIGCGEDQNSDIALDESEYDVKYDNKDLLVKSNIEETATSKNNTKESLNSNNYSKENEEKDVDTVYNLSLVYLYSDYWIGCKNAKPIVDQLEIELDPQIDIKRIDILTEDGNEFSNEYSLSTPGFILLNNSNKELFRFTGVPNKSKFAEQLKEYI